MCTQCIHEAVCKKLTTERCQHFSYSSEWIHVPIIEEPVQNKLKAIIKKGYCFVSYEFVRQCLDASLQLAKEMIM